MEQTDRYKIPNEFSSWLDQNYTEFASYYPSLTNKYKKQVFTRLRDDSARSNALVSYKKVTDILGYVTGTVSIAKDMALSQEDPCHKFWMTHGALLTLAFFSTGFLNELKERGIFSRDAAHGQPSFVALGQDLDINKLRIIRNAIAHWHLSIGDDYMYEFATINHPPLRLSMQEFETFTMASLRIAQAIGFGIMKSQKM